MDQPLDEALSHLGLVAVRPADIQRTIQEQDCRMCVHYWTVLDSSLPLWFQQLLMIEYHSEDHPDIGGSN